MKIGFFSDAHGNETGFTRCYNYLVTKVNTIYYLGDVVGYFPLSNNIINTLRENSINCLKGNHDAMLLDELPISTEKEEIYRILNGRTSITENNKSFLKELYSKVTVDIEGRKLLMVHGSPFNPLEGYVYPDTDISTYGNLGYDAIFMGHTHKAFTKKVGETSVVNVGSCGLPRDIGNKLTVALYDTTTNEAFLKEIEMNVEEVITKYDTEIHSSVIQVLRRNNKIYERE